MKQNLGCLEHDILIDIMVLLNLAPRSIAGLMSEGMLLCAEGPDGTLALMTPEKDVASGSEIC